MIRRADAAMLPCLKHIWQACFGDDRKSTDFVFDKLISPDRMLVYAGAGGSPSAMINWRPLRFVTPWGNLDGAYVFGVATLPEFRGQGISRALMGEVHTALRNEGAALSCLAPASRSLFDFYGGQGFETVFFYKRLWIEAKDILPHADGTALGPARLERLKEARDKAFSGRMLFGGWGAEYLRYAGEECRFYGGETLRFSSLGSQGYAVCYPRDNGILVKEAALDSGALDRLLTALHRRFGASGYELRLPADFPVQRESETVPFAMLRWYDDEKRRRVSGSGGAPWFAFGLD